MPYGSRCIGNDDYYKDPIQTDCGHKFCRLCLTKAGNDKCPICRHRIFEIFADMTIKQGWTFCELCDQPISLAQTMNHNCPFEVIKCPHCNISDTRQNINGHNHGLDCCELW